METLTATPTAADNQPTATKRCQKCGEVKPVTEFHKRSASPDGHQAWCKRCTAIATAERKASQKPQNTLPNHEPSIFDDKQDREVIAEIRLRLHHLRSKGWKFTGQLEYVKTHIVTL